MIASIGSTVLVLAFFGLLFRSGLERLLRGAPGGEAFSEAAERLQELAQDLGDGELDGRGSGQGEESDRVAKDVRTLVEEELPALRNEIAELRKLLTSLENRSGDRDAGPG